MIFTLCEIKEHLDHRRTESGDIIIQKNGTSKRKPERLGMRCGGKVL
jgi:hypothetical protein